MPTMDDVRRETQEFIRRHWDISKLDTEESPIWCEYGLTGTCPNEDRPGCYALVEGGEVTYIGSGASQGHGIYEGCGLGHRLNGYLQYDRTQPAATLADRRYKPKPQYTFTSLHTFGFPRVYGYMALALESFLLNRVPTSDNKHRPGGSLSGTGKASGKVKVNG